MTSIRSQRLLKPLAPKPNAPCCSSPKTVIGKGSPKKHGSSKVHGSPLGADELEAVKKALDWPEEPFFIPQEVKQYFAELRPGWLRPKRTGTPRSRR